VSFLRDPKIIVQRSEPFLETRIDLFAACISPERLAVANELTFTEQPESQVSRPFLRLRHDEAQALVDGLWDCGVRPTNGAGSAGSLAATERHLDDMRSLVFKTPPKANR
jgi:hypothetical protein